MVARIDRPLGFLARSVALAATWWLLSGVPVFAAGLVATPEQLNRQGVELCQQGHPEQALEPLKQAVQASPYQPVIRRNLIEAYLAAAHASMAAHQFRHAADLLLDARKFDANDPRLWLYRAQALVLLREFDAAEVDLQEALGFPDDHDRVEELRLLGRVYEQTGRLPEAIDTWRQAQQLAPDDQHLAQALQRADRALPYERDLDRQVGGQFLLRFDAETDAELGDQILDTLQRAYAEIGSLFDSYPDEQISVLVYTRKDFSVVTASPGWAGGVYDGKIRLPLGGLRTLTPAARAVLYHEYTHVIIRHLTNGLCPTWLNEGIAEIIGRQQFDHPLRALPQAAKAHKLYKFSQLAGSLGKLSGSQALLAYEQSFSFVRFLVDRYGWHTLLELLQDLGAGQPLPRALRNAFGEPDLDLDQLEQRWRDDLAAD